MKTLACCRRRPQDFSIDMDQEPDSKPAQDLPSLLFFLLRFFVWPGFGLFLSVLQSWIFPYRMCTIDFMQFFLCCRYVANFLALLIGAGPQWFGSDSTLTSCVWLGRAACPASPILQESKIMIFFVTSNLLDSWVEQTLFTTFSTAQNRRQEDENKVYLRIKKVNKEEGVDCRSSIEGRERGRGHGRRDHSPEPEVSLPSGGPHPATPTAPSRCAAAAALRRAGRAVACGLGTCE